MSSSAMYVAKTGLTAQQTRMQVISNNLANVNTVGFKSDRVNFESLLYQISRSGGDQTSEDTALTSSLALGTGCACGQHREKILSGQYDYHR
jgi:flagellar basal-body rod protein FlgG